jgi:hypothetical protein
MAPMSHNNVTNRSKGWSTDRGWSVWLQRGHMGAKRRCRGRRRRGRHRAVRRRQRVDRGQRAGWRMAGADRGWGGRDRRGVRAAVA